MQSFKCHGSSLKQRLAGVCGALLACVACLGSVVALFASASGELGPVLAKLQGAPAASSVAVVVKAAVKPAPS